VSRRTLAHFAYEVDKRGNRTLASETLAHPTTPPDTVIAATDKGILVSGTWSNVSSYKESTQVSARLKLTFLGDEATLSMGEGPDHSLYDVYINGTLWHSFDGYAATPAQRDIVVTTDVDGQKLQGEGPHVLEIRNRSEKNASSTDYKVRFKQLAVENRTWTQQTIKYEYDKLSRLKEARYNPGLNITDVNDDLLRHYLYEYDLAGNREMQSVAVDGGSPTVTNYTYNAANQLTSGSAAYDNNGNMTSDGVNSYTWDRANRLLSMDSVDYQYDGEGRRVQQTVSSVATKYLLDIQPGLAVVLSETEGSNVIRNVFSPRGIHAQQASFNNWQWIAQDGLGNVRGVIDNSIGVLESRNYGPYGDTFDGTMTDDLDYEAPNFGFTGELVDGSGLLDLRARRYNAGMGVFANLDPFEGVRDWAMSLNRYGYVAGNPINLADPSGMIYERPEQFATCLGTSSVHNDDCYCYDNELTGFRAFQCRIGEIPTCTDRYAGNGGLISDNKPPIIKVNTPEIRCAKIREYARGLRTTIDNKATRNPNVLHNDVDALTEIIKYAVSFPGVTPQQAADDISCALLNARGSMTLISALPQVFTNKNQTAWDWFGDNGFNSDYQDGGNQINHFWSYVNSAAQGGLQISVIGHVIHEYLAIPEILVGERGASIQDDRLTFLGWGLGLAIKDGYVTSDSMAAAFNKFLTSPYPLDNPTNPDNWPAISLCRWFGIVVTKYKEAEGVKGFIDRQGNVYPVPSDCAPDASIYRHE